MVTNSSELELGGGDRLPWLETAADYDERQRRSWGIVLAVLGGLAFVLLVIGGIWYAQRDGAGVGDGSLIAAPAEPYKTRAEGDDGMNVGNESEAMLATSDGQEARGRIAAGTAPRADAATPPATRALDSASPVPASVPAPMARSGSAVQLGAFADRASAETQWSKLAKGQGSLAGLTHTVEEVRAGGKTVFRLRAAVADAAAGRAVCRSLQSAGAGCFAVR